MRATCMRTPCCGSLRIIHTDRSLARYCSFWGEVTAAQMASQTKLALIQTVTAGYEEIDIDAANKLGIWVSFSPSEVTGNAAWVAEFAVLLMLGASRHLQQLVRLREDSAGSLGIARAMNGKTVCIVGLATSVGCWLTDCGPLGCEYSRPTTTRIVPRPM
jgi:phosphoglycerate dehydrogenase-like enzyme